MPPGHGSDERSCGPVVVQLRQSWLLICGEWWTFAAKSSVSDAEGLTRLAPVNTSARNWGSRRSLGPD